MATDPTSPNQADLESELLDLLAQALDGTDQVRIDIMTRWCLLRLLPDIDLTKPPPKPVATKL